MNVLFFLQKKKLKTKAKLSFFAAWIEILHAIKLFYKSFIYTLLYILKAVKDGLFCAVFLRDGSTLPMGIQDLHTSMELAVEGVEAFNTSLASFGMSPSHLHWANVFRDTVGRMDDKDLVAIVRHVVEAGINVLEGRESHYKKSYSYPLLSGR